MQTTATYEDVNDRYSRIARESAESNAEHSQKVALSFGYSLEELKAIPEGSNLGVSCGNPIALAGLKEVSTSKSFFVLA
jgi:arsenite methyltransferase